MKNEVTTKTTNAESSELKMTKCESEKSLAVCVCAITNSMCLLSVCSLNDRSETKIKSMTMMRARLIHSALNNIQPDRLNSRS